MQGYTPLREIAHTSAYAVHNAIRHKDGQHVAIKVLLRRDDAICCGRFKNEVRLLARLDHPNIVRIVDQDLTAYQPWVATPLYLSDLREYVKTTHDISIEDVAKIYASVLDAVEYAHGQGVIHRDIKPANVLLNSPSDVVLIDFSISISTNGDQTRHTQQGHPLGTPCYLAPEQLHAPGTADARADVFSLGVLLFELLGGKVGSSALDMEPVPQRYRAFIARAISPRPIDRYLSVSEMKRVWRLLHDSELQHSERIEISALASKDSLSVEEVERLDSLLSAYDSDGDLLDRFFVSADRGAIEALASKGSIPFMSVVSRWLIFVEGQSWPFAYTDKIAERCRLLANLVFDQAVRAQIVRALISIGNSHHRYKVWSVAAELMHLCSKNSDDAEFLAAALATHFRCEDYDGVRSYLRLTSLPVCIRSLVLESQPEPV